jgi:diguanylate cyclase (GGDEF)-like protein
MTLVLCPYAVVQIANASLSLCLTAAAMPKGHSTPRNLPTLTLLPFCLALNLWFLAASLEASAMEPWAKIFFSKWEHSFAIFAPFFFLLFSLAFTHPKRRLSWWAVALLGAFPALSTALVWAEPIHGLLWAGFIPGPYMSNSLIYLYGPLASWILLYDFSYGFFSAILFVETASRSVGRFRLQCLYVICALGIVILSLIAETALPSPFPGLDLKPLGFFPANVILLVLLLRHGFLDVARVARDWVIEQMRDLYLVITERDEVLDANPAARDFFGMDKDEGAKAFVFPELWREAFIAFESGSSSRVIAMAEPQRGRPERHWYELRYEPLGGGNLNQGVRSVLVRDVTDLVQKEERLREAFSQLDRRYGESRAQEAALRELALKDHLTGLYNRQYLADNLNGMFADALASGKPLSVAMLDIDFFKDINDRFGHVAGDAILRDLGRFVLRDVRSSDVSARYGGEEFLIVLPGMRGADAARKVSQMLEDFKRKEFFFASGSTFVSFSAGVSELTPDCPSPERLIQEADEALYYSKRNGRSRVSVYK